MHRIEHNQNLLKAWFTARKLRIGTPPVHEQLPTTIVNKRALFPYGYNPSIIRFQNRLLMAYRYHPNGAAASKLAMAELDENLRVTANNAIDLPAGSMEDPRLFLYGGNLCMSYTVSTVPVWPYNCVIRWGILKEGKPWTVEGQWAPQYGKNDGTAMEKNWIFHQHEDQTLRAIYRCDTGQEVIACQEASVQEVGKFSGSRWKWGAFKGGTVPLKLSDGRTFRFFHSRLDNGLKPVYWRYYVGAMVLDGKGNITSVSKKPILTGSEHDDLTPTEAASCVHHKTQCVLPYGAVEADGGWLLSVGVNDSACALVKITEKDLQL